MDDVLVAYGSAQLMTGNNSYPVPVTVEVNALRLGQGTYVTAILVINTFIIAIIGTELLRTRGWAHRLSLD